MKLTTRDIERLNHINYVMNDIYESTTLIYEHMDDEEYSQVREEVRIAINKLTELSNNLEDEV